MNLHAEEVTRLQRCLNDLIGVLAFPAMWSGRTPEQMAGSFLDGLMRVLPLDVAFLRVSADAGGPLDCARVSPNSQADPAWFTALDDDPARWPKNYGPIAIESLRLGLPPGRGVVAVGSRRPGFPFLTEKLLLNVAGNQFLIGLQEAQLRAHQKRAAEELDHRVAQRTAELAAVQRELSQIINTIPALAWSAWPDGSAEFFSEHYLAYVGLPAEQMLGGGWIEAIHPEDRAALVSVWQSILVTGTPGEAEARVRRFDGEYRWFLQRANPIRDATGRVIKWYGINTDIHDRRLSEEALSEARAELANVTRVTSLGVLTASIAHEVNQPLSGIMTNAGACLRLLSMEPPNIEGALETVRRTLRDGKRASDVIMHLRTLYSGKEVQFEIMDLNEAARDVIFLAAGELQRNRVVLRQDLAEQLPQVLGDRIQLQQVILNLMTNASDAMRTVEERPRELLIRTAAIEDGAVCLSVRDCGVGITHQDLDKIFAPFYTTKADGMGIGLSVSRSIIEAHQGRLWAAPNDGPGATFAFSLRPLPAGATPAVG
jgi:PAS domain S-box-containing protein